MTSLLFKKVMGGRLVAILDERGARLFGGGGGKELVFGVYVLK